MWKKAIGGRAPRNVLRTLSGLALCASAFGCSSQSFKAEAPKANEKRVAIAPLPPMPKSVIDAPIQFALAPALSALERSVPTEFGDITKRIVNTNNKRQQFAFSAKRSPFKVAIRGQQLSLETIVEYQGSGWYDPPLAPTIGASCGKDVRPRLRVQLSANLALSKDWRLRTHTVLDSVAPLTTEERDKCRVTFLSFDVTEKVINAVNGILLKKLPEIDQKLAAFDVRTPLERWYNLLNKQFRVSDSLWLVFNPAEVNFGGMYANDTAIVAEVRLYARPAITSGVQPAVVTRSLPPLVRAPRAVGDSLHVMVDGRLSYDVASDRLQRALKGKRFTKLGRSVRIDSAQLYGLGDGRVVLALTFRGAIDGKAYLVGTPQLDRANHMLTVPDLSFDIGTNSALASGLAWITRGDVVEELRRRAQLPLTDVVDKIRERVEVAMNRDVAKGVHLNGELESGRIVDVIALEEEVLVRFEITGSLGLGINREIRLRKKKVAPPKDTAPAPAPAAKDKGD